MKRHHIPWYLVVVGAVISGALGLEKLEIAPWGHMTKAAAASRHEAIEKTAETQAKDEADKVAKEARKERDILMNAVITNQVAIDKLGMSIESKLDAVNNKLWNMNNPKAKANQP